MSSTYSKLSNFLQLWLNTVIQTFYICETNSNNDYPNTGKYCAAFANEFYKIIAGKHLETLRIEHFMPQMLVIRSLLTSVTEFPHYSIIRILETIKPTYMKHLIGILHIKNLLATDENCIIKNLITFIRKEMWNKFPQSEEPIKISTNSFFKPVKVKRQIRKLMKLYSQEIPEENEPIYWKITPKSDDDDDVNRNQIVYTLFLTLEAYLDAYSVQNVQETLDNLNEQLLNNNMNSNDNFIPEIGSYSVTEHFIKKYRSIYQMLRELVVLLQERKAQGDSADNVFDVFKNIELLSL